MRINFISRFLLQLKYKNILKKCDSKVGIYLEKNGWIKSTNQNKTTYTKGDSIFTIKEIRNNHE